MTKSRRRAEDVADELFANSIGFGVASVVTTIPVVWWEIEGSTAIPISFFTASLLSWNLYRTFPKPPVSFDEWVRINK